MRAGKLFHERHCPRAAGFTLVEMIVTLVVMSILSIGVVRFVMDSSAGYVATANRNQVSASGRVVVDRISMELHNALPQSVRTTSVYTSASAPVLAGDASAGDQCIEFVPIRAASSYIDPAFRPDDEKSLFTVVDFVPDQDGVSGVYAAIYPSSPDEIYGASFTGDTTESIVDVTVQDANGGDGVNELSSSHDHRFKRRSPVNRIFLADQPVSFCTRGSRVYRYDNYGFHLTQLRPVNIGGACGAAVCLPSSTPNRVLISTQADNVELADGGSLPFNQIAANRRRNAMVQLDLNFSRGGESVRINHEVLLHNVP